MLSGGLLLDAAGNLLVGIVSVGVGFRVGGRHVWSGDRPAVQAFAAWWVLFGVQSVVTSLRIGLVASGDRSVAVFSAFFYGEVVLSFLALAGMAVYLYYVSFGRYLWRRWMFGGAVAVALAYVAVIAWHGPMEVHAEGFRTNLSFAHTLASPLRWLLVLGYYVPMAGMGAVFFVIARNSAGAARRRAYSASLILLGLAAGDAAILGPQEGGPWVPVATFVKAAVGLLAGYVYLRAEKDE